MGRVNHRRLALVVFALGAAACERREPVATSRAASSKEDGKTKSLGRSAGAKPSASPRETPSPWEDYGVHTPEAKAIVAACTDGTDRRAQCAALPSTSEATSCHLACLQQVERAQMLVEARKCARRANDTLQVWCSPPPMGFHSYNQPQCEAACRAFLSERKRSPPSLREESPSDPAGGAP